MAILAPLISATNLYPHLPPTSDGFSQYDLCRRAGRGLPGRYMFDGSEIKMMVSTSLLQRASGHCILDLAWASGSCSWGGIICHASSKVSFVLLEIEFCCRGSERNLAWEVLASLSLISWCQALFASFGNALSFYKIFQKENKSTSRILLHLAVIHLYSKN